MLFHGPLDHIITSSFGAHELYHRATSSIGSHIQDGMLHPRLNLTADMGNSLSQLALLSIMQCAASHPVHAHVYTGLLTTCMHPCKSY
eukprot:1913166-Karenia_brevis.AAC.1